MTEALVPQQLTWTLNDMVTNGTLAPADALRVLADLQLERRRHLRAQVQATEAVAA